LYRALCGIWPKNKENAVKDSAAVEALTALCSKNKENAIKPSAAAESFTACLSQIKRIPAVYDTHFTH
jgi:hypothetical protein